MGEAGGTNTFDQAPTTIAGRWYTLCNNKLMKTTSGCVPGRHTCPVLYHVIDSSGQGALIRLLQQGGCSSVTSKHSMVGLPQLCICWAFQQKVLQIFYATLGAANEAGSAAALKVATPMRAPWLNIGTATAFIAASSDTKV